MQSASNADVSSGAKVAQAKNALAELTQKLPVCKRDLALNKGGRRTQPVATKSQKKELLARTVIQSAQTTAAACHRRC